MHCYDVIIIGGGLVGAGFATALKGMNLRIALVEARVPTHEDPRLFALNAGSCDFLDNIGVWSSIVNEAEPIQTVHVSSRGHFGATRLKSDDAGMPCLGYVIPAYFVERALDQQMLTNPALDIYRPATLYTLVQEENGVTLNVSTRQGNIQLHADLVIGADGADSAVRRLAGIGSDEHDYQQSAIVTRTSLTRAHHNIAYERFTDDGTIAMLPLSGNESATIWSGNNANIDQLMQMCNDDFLQALQYQFGYRLGRLDKIALRNRFPLRMVLASTMTKGNIFLLGNAAHALHPVAAQGFNLALYEAAILVEAVEHACLEKRKINATDLQNVYANIKQQQSASIRVSHQLASHLSGRSGVIRHLLPPGLIGLDLAATVRKRFVRKIMGRTGRIPRLLMSVNT